MCTALSFTKKEHYFGRNLDWVRSYGEKVCIVPRNMPLLFRRAGALSHHYAMIGMATVAEETPLFYDAVNEAGLCMAGLNFAGNAFYHPEAQGKDNIPPFEFITWILSQCATVEEARGKLERLNLTNLPFSDQLPLATLHWIISDRNTSLVVESVADGLHVYENPLGVMTNNPPFPYQVFNLSNYRALSSVTPENRLLKEKKLDVYSQGLGALGLPGDLSSMSRFVRMVFHSQMAMCEETEESCVSQFFHLLGSVEMPRGSCQMDQGGLELTLYSCCMNADAGRYYYTTYDNRRITCVDLHKADLDGRTLTTWELMKKQSICYQNVSYRGDPH